MNDTMVTVQGWLGNDPQVRSAAGVPVANFRVACTPRRLRRDSGEWVDGPTQWYGVSAWRGLADHCGRSLRRGDPVILHGRLSQRSYVNKHDIEVIALEIEAVTIGHDLSRGVSVFSKTTRGARTEARGQEQQQAAPPEWAVPGASEPVMPTEPVPQPPQNDGHADRTTAAA